MGAGLIAGSHFYFQALTREVHDKAAIPEEAAEQIVAMERGGTRTHDNLLESYSVARLSPKMPF